MEKKGVKEEIREKKEEKKGRKKEERKKREERRGELVAPPAATWEATPSEGRR